MRRIKALINGTWHGALEETAAVRAALADRSGGFHDQVSKDGSSGFEAEPGRYHLYVSYACPWAHRTIIYRELKGLGNVVSMSVLHPRWAGPDGWRFTDGRFGTVDHVAGHQFLHQVYSAAGPDYTGRVTVPVLWDRQTGTIVSNESQQIIRMLNSAFDEWGNRSVDFYPKQLRTKIDALNAWLIPTICAGVYAAGFARNQQAHAKAVRSLFDGLDELERRLSGQRYLLGERLTESDWHLFATLCRFDAAYYGALKCNLRRLVDYPALSNYTRRLHQIPGVAQTVRFEHIKRHYYDAIGEINPTIVPLGPASDYRVEGHAPIKTPIEDINRHRFVGEILGLHRYLEDWLKGNLPCEESEPARLAQALAEDFRVIHPSGKEEDRSQVIRNFGTAHGSKPGDYRLHIQLVSLRMLGDSLCLATYRESHQGEPARDRISTALLRLRPRDETIEWLFLQETFTDKPQPAIVPATVSRLGITVTP